MKLVRGYTRKQWEKGCKDLPSFIIKRDFLFVIPMIITILRIPYRGYSEGRIPHYQASGGCQVCTKTDFFANREELTAQADKILLYRYDR